MSSSPLTTATEHVMSVREVHKTYTGRGVPVHALRGVDLDIDTGSYTCLIGPSGHGKSTLLHLLGGLDRPTSGSVTVLGQHIERMSDTELARFRATRVGFVFQFFNLLKGLTVAENVELAMMYAGAPVREQKRRAAELLEAVGLAAKRDARANELSGGQMQRVAIARALANDPEVLLLDEPTGNLDSASEADVLAILDDLHAEGRTIVMVTHGLDIAARAERIVEVHDGQAVLTPQRGSHPSV
jgi:putative ABC transport system ATP-binding protein